MNILRQVSAVLLITLAGITFSTLHAEPIAPPSKVVFSSQNGTLARYVTYPWGTVRLPRHPLASDSGNGFAHIEASIPKPEGKKTQWIELQFRGENFFATQTKAHASVFLRGDHGSSWYPPRGKGLILGYYYKCSTTIPVAAAELTAHAPYGTNLGNTGITCPPAITPLRDYVTYKLVLHAADTGMAFTITNLTTNQVVTDMYVADTSYPFIAASLNTGDAQDVAYQQMNGSTAYFFGVVFGTAGYNWTLTFSEIRSGWF